MKRQQRAPPRTWTLECWVVKFGYNGFISSSCPARGYQIMPLFSTHPLCPGPTDHRSIGYWPLSDCLFSHGTAGVASTDHVWALNRCVHRGNHDSFSVAKINSSRPHLSHWRCPRSYPVRGHVFSQTYFDKTLAVLRGILVPLTAVGFEYFMSLLKVCTHLDANNSSQDLLSGPACSQIHGYDNQSSIRAVCIGAQFESSDHWLMMMSEAYNIICDFHFIDTEVK